MTIPHFFLICVNAQVLFFHATPTYLEALDVTEVACVGADGVGRARVAGHVGPTHALGVQGQLLINIHEEAIGSIIYSGKVRTLLLYLPHDLSRLVDGVVDHLEGNVRVLAELADPNVPCEKNN